ncbi:uncharacterized membrane protein YhaH (DUF805 family) [Microbacterium sp. SORGH_AS 1204]|uniref:hypothetical protein n=1 Tax=Microbacterium sp. SORGH_AS_1204 TaxID=3041785 RepID=UPI002792A459|nr:hypothetical protein [Microbacterium sp. SORGH_AS_1204]MDQ1137854.1 uncharacterized membrane protein YhaH (DUF805 family) [Microbacterium sp. SORGH_AS_1204]
MTPSDTPSERRVGSHELTRRSGASAPQAQVRRSPAPPPYEPPAKAAKPERPALHDKAAAPVMVKMPPPAGVRLAQICWVLSLVVGAIAVGYLFVIRQSIDPDIEAIVREVDASRPAETVSTAADIVFWCVFGALVTVLLVQITSLVSFNNRRNNARWWMLGVLLLLAVTVLAARQFVAVGDRGVPLDRLLLIQLGLSGLGLLFSVIPAALRWTRRKHDIRRGSPGSPSAEF